MKNLILNTSLILLPTLGLSQLYIPNAFTPNNDGLNDFWKVSVEDSLITQYHCQITNRWGDIIWESKDPSDKWLGGDEYYSPNGIYQYMVVYNDKKYFGSLYLIL